MQLKFRYFYGGDWNPFQKETAEVYKKLSEERKLVDPMNEEPTDKVLPNLQSWAEYVILESKSTFWKMERDVGKYAEEKTHGIEVVWGDALSQHKVDKWILDAEGDETEKALCYYMKVLHGMFAPNDRTVNFRLYFSESGRAKRLNTDDSFSLTPYEG